MIPKILEKIEDNSVMYLINAIAFDAKWQSPYEKEDVEAGTFTSENGTQQTVDMMYSTEAYYLEDDSTTGFIRPYEDGYSFVALLPKEGYKHRGLYRSVVGRKTDQPCWKCQHGL